ncbi:MAG: rhodanese-like domain-containing protein [Lautropia sp.]
MKQLTPVELGLAVEARSERTVYVIDVRSEEEFAAGHIPGSIHVPGGQLVQTVDDHIVVRDSQVILVSGHGIRAAVAAWWLSRMKWCAPAILKGGLAQWRTGGNVIEPSAAPSVAAVPLIDPEALLKCIQERRCAVLDIGSSIRYDRRHVPSARWVTPGWLELAVPPALDASIPVVVTGAPSPALVEAVCALTDIGYECSALSVSVEEWARRGFPVGHVEREYLIEPRDIDNVGMLHRDPDAMRRYLEWEVNLV